MSASSTFRLLTAVALAASSSAVHAAVDAPIKSVVLFPGGAMVQREITVTGSTSALEVGNLPTGFALESLRVEAGEGVHVGQVTARDEATAQVSGPREAALEAKIESLKDQEAELEVQAKAAERLGDFLGHLGASDGKTPLAIDPARLPQLIDSIQKGWTVSYATQHRIELQKRALDRQIDTSQRDLDNLRGSARAVRTIHFPVGVDHPGRITLSYPMDNAGWVPQYRALLDTHTGKVTLERRALIYQQTGEDWNGVQLRLSTGRPQADASAPVPDTWYLNIEEPMRREAKALRAAALMEESAKAVPSAPAPVMNAPAPPQEVQTMFATEFEVPTAVSLPADGSRVTLTLNSQSLEATARIRTAPRLEAAAYVEAEAQRPEGVWLPGEVQLLRDGSYVGKLEWQPDAADKFVLSFGRDDRVRVKVSRNHVDTHSASLIGSRRTREVRDTFTVTSSHATAFPLLVLESTPVSSTDTVKVEKAFSPQVDETNWDQTDGVVAWRRTLEPNGKLSFDVHYTVTYPKDVAVAGLP